MRVVKPQTYYGNPFKECDVGDILEVKMVHPGRVMARPHDPNHRRPRDLMIDFDCIMPWSGFTEEDEAEAIKSITETALKELDRVVAETEATLPETREWTAQQIDGEWVTKCPHCGATDEIYEVDRAIRWNSLSFNSSGKVYAYTGDYEFESDGWICGGCCSTDLEAPPDFEITDYA